MFLETLYEMLQEAITPATMYHAITDKIKNSEVGVERNGNVTDTWTAGVSASRGAIDGKVARALMALEAGRFDPETKEYRDAMRLKIAFDTLASYGYIRKLDNGRYAFPPTNEKGAKRRAFLSDFRDYVSGGFNQAKVDNDTAKMAREHVDAESKKWAESLSEEQKGYLNIYSNLDIPSFTFLRGLIMSRKQRAEYNKRIVAARSFDSNEYVNIKQLGLLDDRDNLNMDLLRKYDAFIKAQNPARLKPFKKSVAEFNNRQVADKALARNEFNKQTEEDQVHHPETDAIAQSRLHGIKGDRRAQRTVDRNTSFKKYMNTGA